MQDGSGSSPVGGRRHAPGYLPMVALIALSAAVFGWDIWLPSPWWDEAVSRHVVALPFSGILALVHSVDLVHFCYYLIGHCLYLILGSPAGSNEVFVALRLLSALAAVLTAVTLVRIGRALGAPEVGFTAGLLFTVSPFASRYAQEARPYALVTLVATVSTALLIDAMADRRVKRWIGYCVAIVVLGLLNELALLIVPVHLAFCWRFGTRAASRRASVAAAAAVLGLAPFLFATTRQDAQVSWLTIPGLSALPTYYRLLWNSLWLTGALLLLGLARWVRSGRPDGEAAGDRKLPETALPVLGLLWASVPPVLLWAISQGHALFTPRYLVFCLPGAALALASLAVLVPSREREAPGRRRAVVPVVVVLVLTIAGLPAQVRYRDRDHGHAEDIRGAAALVQRNSHTSDAVVFIPAARRIVERAYPESFTDTDDIALTPTSSRARDLYGAETTDVGLFAHRLEEHPRVWVISSVRRLGDTLSALDEEKRQMISSGYVPVRSRSDGGFIAALYISRDDVAASARRPVQNCPYCP